MPTTQPSYDVAIVGAGVSGCASALGLAPDHDVAVFDRGQVAGEASGLAAGLVAPTLFHADRPDVARHANPWFREFDGTGRFEFHERPRVELMTPDRAPAGRKRAARLADEGFPVSFLDCDTLESAFPWFDTDRFEGAVVYRDTGWVDPYAYTTSLAEAAQDEGVDLYTGVSVAEIRDDGDAVTGIETDDGRVEADHVVVTVGWRTPTLLPESVSLPLKPFRLQCAVLRPDPRLPREFPLGRVADDELYFRGQLNGDFLVGGGEYLESTPEVAAGGVGIDDDFRRHVATTVPTFMSEFATAEFVDGWAGVDAGTPDTVPILDAPDSAPSGLVVATGFNGLGMVNSPVAATAVRSLVTGEDAPFPLEHFALDRFPDDVDFDVQGTFEAAGAGQ